MMRKYTSSRYAPWLVLASVLLAFVACDRSTPEIPTLPPPTATSTSEIVPSATISSPTGSPVVTTSPPVTPTASPTTTPQSCTDVADFVDDITIEDNTEMQPGQTFTKTWRLTNIGTCTWTQQYSLVFTSGEKMGGQSPSPLKAAVPPGATVDLSVDLKAPEAAGAYQGDWFLRNADNELFGTGDNGQYSIYVKIVVKVAGEQITLGSPTWLDPMNSGANWYLVDTALTRFTPEGGALVLQSYTPGSIEEWGFCNQPALKDFYLEMTERTGDTCSGHDRYGFIVRSPDASRGYVFTFACNGDYRLYKWDAGTFTGLKNWTGSTYILSGPNQTNKLGIEAVGNQIKLYANRKVLAVITDSSFAEGRFGLVVGSAETANFKVYVDEVAYWFR